MRACNFFGGPERQILGHIEHSRDFRHQVLTFAQEHSADELSAECRRRGIAVESIATRSAYGLSSVWKLREVFRKLKPAILCSHGYRPTLLGLLARLGLGLPLIVFSRGHTGENRKVGFFEELELRALRFADGIVAVSAGYAERLRLRGIKGSIAVVQNAIDAERMAPFVSNGAKRQELGFKGEDILVATAGRLSPEKAQGDLISAFAAIQAQYPQAHLLLAGDGPSRSELEEQVRGTGLKNVHFLGFRRDMDAIMCAVDIFVLPSRTEGLPNVALEAFAARKPVVATRVGGVPEVVDEGVSGYLVPPGRPDLLAGAVIKALENPELLRDMGRMGFERVVKDFTFEAQALKLEAIYQDLMKRSPLSPQ